MIIIQTERLVLRQFRFKDAKNLFKLNDDPEVMLYTGDPPFKSEKGARIFIENYGHYQKHGFGRWAVILKDNSDFIGWCGFKQHVDYVDLGFRFYKKYWGKGYATEAAIGCLDYGLDHLDLEEVVGRVASKNKASIRVLEKLGMTFWKEDECNGIENSLYFRLELKS